ncbi:hypothetical protein ARHIZOSPH14_27680 [Agromyces rhizosphaerae]|uniref:Septum formation-related domain-containing protein n=1 Tax=Agromyces rhizosphaerae TaxID=88374 RepID=A0A9W6CT51_9MICO|nr:hypothetical protein [Agromyces rhizosphaerae]GLI28526.1 hypothetical protein ARHIZOSPH14_27680 [Agromyces rhizosphaerae]
MRDGGRLARAVGRFALAASAVAMLAGCSLVADAFRPGGVVELPSSPEPITEAGVRQPSELLVGDCVGDFGPDGIVDVVPVMPCSDPHLAEAFHEFDLGTTSLPSDDELFPMVAAECDAAFESFVGVEWSLSSLNWYYFAPTVESWDEVDDRRVLCMVFDPAGLTTGTLAGAGPGAADASAWVVVSFEGDEQFDLGLMDALLPTELEADSALNRAGAGRIDGNDIGDHGYELYFVGDDADEMWEILGPVFAEAPVRWTGVELRDGLEDPSPTVIVRD